MSLRLENVLSEMQKVADAADISVLFFSAGANFWAILGHFLGHFGSFWVILGPFWAICGHIWATLGHFGSFLAIFGPFRGIFGQICGMFKFFCGPVGVAGLAFRMYGLSQNPTGSNNPPFLCTGFSNISAFFF